MTTEQSILPAIQGLFYIVAGTDFNYVVQSLKDPQDLIQKSRETAAASSRTFLLLSVMFHAADALIFGALASGERPAPLPMTMRNMENLPRLAIIHISK